MEQVWLPDAANRAWLRSALSLGLSIVAVGLAWRYRVMLTRLAHRPETGHLFAVAVLVYLVATQIAHGLPAVP